MIGTLNLPIWLLVMIIALIIWDTIWKGIGLWKSGRNNQLVWFVCILVFNTVGILPIVYILFFQTKKFNRQRAKSRKN